MKEEKDSYPDESNIEAVNRFRRSLKTGRMKYFDVAEFEGIVEQLLEEGDLKTSEIAIKHGISIHPNAIPLQLKFAQVLINKGKYIDALKNLQAAEKVDSNNPDVHLLKGTAQMVLGVEKEALRSFRKAIKFGGDEIDEIYYQIGSTYVQTGNIRKALLFFEKTVKANPDHDLALYDLGYFYDQENNLLPSIEYYNRYLDIDPFNQYVWFNLGTVYNKADLHDKAIEAYEYAYAINTEFYMALFNIGNALANAGRFVEAIDRYNEFLLSEPDSDEAWCYIGECYLNTDEHKLSEDHYRKALSLNKNNDTALFGLGLISWLQINYKDALKYLNKAIRIDRENPEYWLTLGKIQNDVHDKNAAVHALKKAARLDISNSETWLTWADIYVNHNEMRNAIRILNKGIELNSEPILKYRLTALLLQSRKQKEALNLLETALLQDFTQLSFLYEIYPRAINNKKVTILVERFLQNPELGIDR